MPAAPNYEALVKVRVCCSMPSRYCWDVSSIVWLMQAGKYSSFDNEFKAHVTAVYAVTQVHALYSCGTSTATHLVLVQCEKGRAYGC